MHIESFGASVLSALLKARRGQASSLTNDSREQSALTPSILSSISVAVLVMVLLLITYVPVTGMGLVNYFYR